MPKGKKKGKGKGKGKQKGAKAPPPPKQTVEEPLDASSKEFYLIQIRDLEGRLVRYQAKCDKLQSSNEALEKQLQQQLEDQESIITLLKKKIQEQSSQQMELEEAIMVLREEKDAELEKLQLEIAAVREDAQDRLDQIASENTVLRATLDSLEEYRINKESYDAILQKLQDTIKKKQKDAELHVYQLEKQAVLDRDRMRKEMVAKVNLVAAEFRKMSDLQMADTTKRAIQENVSVNHQLHKMSEKTTDLVRENEKLTAKEKELRKQLEIAEANEREITRKNISIRKVLGMLTDKTKELEAQLAELSWYRDQYKEMEQKLLSAEWQSQSASSEAEVHRTEVAKLNSQLEHARQDYSSATKELHRLQKALTNASQAIQTALQPQGSSMESDQRLQRESLLITLLNLMSTSSSAGGDGQATPGNFISPVYKPGAFGLVPAAGKGERGGGGRGGGENPRRPPAIRTELPPIQTGELSLRTHI